MKLVSLTASYSVFIAQALVIKESDSTHPPIGEMISILFDAETVKLLKLQPGSCVFVCPPWYVNMSACFCMFVRVRVGNYKVKWLELIERCYASFFYFFFRA